MTQIRFFTDEDIYGAVAVALRNAGYDSISTPEANRITESDDGLSTATRCILLDISVVELWQTHFPYSPGAAASPVPEPASFIGMLFVAGVLGARRARKVAMAYP